MITPDETTATAIFKKKGKTKEGGKGDKLLALAYVAVPRWKGERKEVRYNLLERVSLVHEEAAEDHGHGQSCAARRTIQLSAYQEEGGAQTTIYLRSGIRSVMWAGR